MAGLVALDLASPGAFRRLMARVQAETIAHHLIRAGEWSLDHRSDSGSIYLRHRHRTTHQRLRLSDHDLGYGDYGTREQIHRGGPDIVFDGEGSFESVLADTLQAIADDAESRSACLVDWLAGPLADSQAAMPSEYTAEYHADTQCYIVAGTGWCMGRDDCLWYSDLASGQYASGPAFESATIRLSGGSRDGETLR